MGTLDVIIVLALLPSLYFGLKNGLVKQIVAFGVVYLGITLSLRFADPVSEWFAGFAAAREWTIPEIWIKIIAFVFIFFAVALIISLLGRILEKIIKITLLEWLNRLLGFVMSLFIFMMGVSLLIYFVDSLNANLAFIPEEWIEQSSFYKPMLGFAGTVFPYLRELF